MAKDVAAASQWEERNGAATAPSISRVYITNDSGIYRTTSDPSEADAWLVADATTGIVYMEPTDTGARTFVKSGTLTFDY